MAFDRSLAQDLVQASFYSYDFDLAHFAGPVTVLEDIHEPGFAPTSNASLLEFPDKRVLAFQGTITEFRHGKFDSELLSLIDWAQNFKALRRPSALVPGEVHDGFLNQLLLIWDQIVAALNAVGKNKPLFITGHSQGGAIAAIATKALELKMIDVRATYTFAAPRAGDGTFRDSVQTPVYRLEFGDDIVPHVPLQLIVKEFLAEQHGFLGGIAQDLLGKLLDNFKEDDGYEAVGNLIYRRPDGPLQMGLSAADETSLALERIKLLAKGKSNLAEHHHLSNYLNMITED
ncbi:MAG: lipase family protein [Planctomycetaceae bacterium]|nr:lipase family protein [Planctomycetaceae bacterium]